MRGSAAQAKGAAASDISSNVDRTSELLGGKTKYTYVTPQEWAGEALPWLTAEPPRVQQLRVMYSMEFAEDAKEAKREWRRDNMHRDMAGAEKRAEVVVASVQLYQVCGDRKIVRRALTTGCARHLQLEHV